MNSPRILVMDAQDRPALAAIRCLSAAGFQVTGTANSRMAPGLWSRACSARIVLPDVSTNVQGFVRQLEQYLASNPHDAVLAGTDESLYAISRHRDCLVACAELGLPTHEVVERALDKTCLAREAERVGLAPPDGQVCSDADEAAAAAGRFGFPVLVKGLRTIAAIDGRIVRYRSRIALDERHLRELQREFGACIVQRRLTGAVLSLGGVVVDGRILAAVVSRYRRTWPPDAGSVSFSSTVEPPDALVERVERLVAAIGWQGLFELELIEGDDGAIKAIDFNPRLYGSLSLASASGVPLTALWSDALLGKPGRRTSCRAGVAYRWEDADARHTIWQLRRGNIDAAAAAIRPQRHVVHAYFRTSDPLPFVVRCLELGQQRWRRSRAKR